MKKRALIFSLLFLLFYTLNYTYSSFKNTIVGDISATTNEWSFKATIAGSTKENDYYKIPVSTSSGSFVINVDTTSSNKNADYSIIISGDGLPSDIKFYSDSSYTKEIKNNLYSGSVEKGSNKSITIYYKSSSTVKGNIIVNIKATIQELAMMKNGNSAISDSRLYFWKDAYRPYIRTITFGNDLSNLPSSCTEENLCWDISYDASQKKKVYGYLTDRYNLYIVSEAPIFAPIGCNRMFLRFENLIQINFNDNFNTSKVTNMSHMFFNCSSLTSLDLSSFNTSNVTDMSDMFDNCSSLTNLDLSSFNTSNVMDMSYMFDDCSSLTSLVLSSFDTSRVTAMRHMFGACLLLTSLDLSSFNTSNVTDMDLMFASCSSLTSLDLSNFNTSNVTDMNSMFKDCKSLTSLNLSSFNTSKVTNVSYMFYKCTKLQTEITIMNTNITNYSSMFQGTATASGAKVTVNYTSATNSLVDKMIATKSYASKVYKGKRV